MIAAIRNYKVGVCRGLNPGPVRTLDFEVETRDDRRVDRIFIHFFEKPQDSIGFMNLANNSVAIFLPQSDFETILELLRSPDEVFVAWVEDAEGNLVWGEVTTSEHAIGPSAHLGEAPEQLKSAG